MSHFEKWIFAAALISQQSLACVSGPVRPVSFKGASFQDVDLRLDDGVYGATLKTDQSQISYDLNLKKWCASSLDDKAEPQCLESGGKLFLRDKGKAKKGVVEAYGRQLFIWSVDSSGKVDKNLPYLAVRDASTVSPGANAGVMDYDGALEVMAYSGPGPKGRMAFYSSSRGKLEVTGKPTPVQYESSKYRGGPYVANDDRSIVELNGGDHTVRGCGKLETRPYRAPEVSSLTPAQTAPRD